MRNCYDALMANGHSTCTGLLRIADLLCHCTLVGILISLRKGSGAVAYGRGEDAWLGTGRSKAVLVDGPLCRIVRKDTFLNCPDLGPPVLLGANGRHAKSSEVH